MLWEEYRFISEDFWELRAEMNEKNKQDISKAYNKRRDATSDWYEGMRMLRKTRTFSGIFASTGEPIEALTYHAREYSGGDTERVNKIIVLFIREYLEKPTSLGLTA